MAWKVFCEVNDNACSVIHAKEAGECVSAIQGDNLDTGHVYVYAVYCLSGTES